MPSSDWQASSNEAVTNQRGDIYNNIKNIIGWFLLHCLMLTASPVWTRNNKHGPDRTENTNNNLVKIKKRTDWSQYYMRPSFLLYDKFFKRGN